MTDLDRLQALARDDKWFLSAGDGCLWTPPFPRWLHRPGFWDAAHLYHFPLEPLYSVALVEPDGREDALVRRDLEWRPDRLRVVWTSASGHTLVEERYVLTGGRFCSTWRVEHKGGWTPLAAARLSLVAFGAVDGGRVEDLAAEDGALSWRTVVTDRKGQSADVDVTLATATGPARVGAVRSEGVADPDWGRTPFVELWRSGGGQVLGTVSAEGVSDRGWLHTAVAVPLRAVGKDEAVTFVLTARPRVEVEVEEGAEASTGDSSSPATPSAAVPTPEASTDRWTSMLAGYPRFTCSDPYLQRYFDYRAYGLFLNRIQGGEGRIPFPAIAEGIEYFHLPITYSAQCHMWETRWSTDPATARGSLRNFLAAQRPDGSLPGRLYVSHQVGEDFYHADWGDAALAVDALHPDPVFLEAAYAGLSRYAGWLRAARDPEGSGMVTVVNHYETGQEYMSRYIAVDADADVNEWEPRLSLKGVDVTVYLYQLLRALETLARRLGEDADAARWAEAAERTGRAIRERMWDPATGMFSDVDGATGRRTGVQAAVCFYPLMTDLLDDAQVDRLLAHLDDAASFATEFPLPSSAVSDPFFDADGLWKGKRMNCPWNGRVWPMTNSHVVEGLLRQWHQGRAAAGPVAARILSRFVRMMYHDGNLDRANCYEHYNPRTGHACVFRGIDDYQHSWVLDLLARGAAGVEPTPAALVVHPLPMGLEDVTFSGTLRGREVTVRVRGEAVEAIVDGTTHRTRIGTPLEVPWA